MSTTDMKELPRETGPGGRNIPAIAGISIVGAFFLVALFADFIAPYDPSSQERGQPSAPASRIRFTDTAGNFHIRPFIYPQELKDPLFLRYKEDVSRPEPIGLFVRGEGYRFLGFARSDLRLFGTVSGRGHVRLLGADSLGRDRFSRLVHAIRFSLIAAPLGTLLATLIGILLGIVSGYAAGLADTALMGVADAMLSLPALILILAARAAFPLDLPPFTAGLLIVGIFSLIGWAEMARLVRSLVRSARQMDYVMAATAIGCSRARVLFRHILPNVSGPILTQATVMLPAFLLAEVSLSFLGVGLQEPVPSLGNMLAAAGDITQLARQPFLLLSPAIVIFLFVMGVRLAARVRRD